MRVLWLQIEIICIPQCGGGDLLKYGTASLLTKLKIFC